MPNSVRQSHFAPAFLFLSKERRQALNTLYAVCRVIDDAVDVGHENPGAFLTAWRHVFYERKTDALAQFGVESLGRAFLAMAEQFGVPLTVMGDLIDKGVAVDLVAKQRFETPMDLERYCYGVAGTVGVACLAIFGVPPEEGRQFAIRLGIAIQWVNMIRDVGVDAQLGRIYLPLEHLDHFGYTEQEIFDRKPSPQFRQLMDYESSIARSHYRRAMELMPAGHRKPLLPARIMAQIYLDLLRKCEQRGFPVFQEKIRLTLFEKLKSTIRTLYT